MTGTTGIRNGMPDGLGASSEAIEFHYGVSNRFYELWLDPHMIYSCALWEEGDGLEQAQLRKLDYLAGQVSAPGADRVLDIGCGWGGLLARLTQVHGVRRAVGLTLSQAQVDYIEGRALPAVEVRLESWEAHRPDAGYDAVISIGAFEHFARPGLRRADRVAGYRGFFAACREWLPPGRRLALQTITKGNNVRLTRRTLREMAFVMERIFPESELPWLSEIVEASERRFRLVNLRSDGEHYARTTAAWRERLRRHRDDAIAVVGQPRYSEYETYLDTCRHHFELGHLDLVRLTFGSV